MSETAAATASSIELKWPASTCACSHSCCCVGSLMFMALRYISAGFRHNQSTTPADLWNLTVPLRLIARQARHFGATAAAAQPPRGADHHAIHYSTTV